MINVQETEGEGNGGSSHTYPPHSKDSKDYYGVTQIARISCVPMVLSVATLGESGKAERQATRGRAHR